MRRATLLLSAAALDWLVGDPEGLPHPVRLIGYAVTRAEARLRPGQEPARDLRAGLLLAGSTALAAYGLTRGLLAWTRRLHPRLGDAAEVWLASSCLAARNLDDEARAVLDRQHCGDLAGARLRLARIVGRDTALLDEAGISRALIETLAESACDGVVAPLFFLAIGGVPAAMTFKAVSTMDSMIGHRSAPYLYFGRSAARLDDAANLLPARLTAWLLLGLGGSAARKRGAVRVYQRDRYAHASPNAGHPEAAMAGVLGVQLGGASTYAGEAHAAPLLGAGLPLPSAADARHALRLTRATGLAATLLCASAALLLRRLRR